MTDSLNTDLINKDLINKDPLNKDLTNNDSCGDGCGGDDQIRKQRGAGQGVWAAGREAPDRSLSMPRSSAIACTSPAASATECPG